MSAAPRASVLLPVRNAAAYLAEALATLRAQTFEDFEVVLQDDGSTDGSIDVAGVAARLDPRVRVERGPAVGIVSALGRAAARARSDLLVRMDADDRARPRRIEALIEAAAGDPEASFFASQIRYFPRDTLSEGMRRYEDWINACVTHDEIVRERFVECPMPHPSWAIRRATYDALGGYRDGDFPEDYDLFLRAADAGVRFHKVEEVLLDWREGGHRASRTDPRYRLDRFFALKAAHLVPHLRASGRDVVIVGAGRGARRWLRHLEAAGLPVRPASGNVDPTALHLAVAGLRAERERLRGSLPPASIPLA